MAAQTLAPAPGPAQSRWMALCRAGAAGATPAWLGDFPAPTRGASALSSAASGRRQFGRRGPSTKAIIMSNLRVVYPGTFDPFTRGHNDLVRRAAKMFDHVTVAVAESQRKAPFFLLPDRVEMAREVREDVPNVHFRS